MNSKNQEQSLVICSQLFVIIVCIKEWSLMKAGTKSETNSAVLLWRCFSVEVPNFFFRVYLQLLKLHLPLQWSYLHINLYFRSSHHHSMFHSFHAFVIWLTLQIGLLPMYGCSYLNWLEHCSANREAVGSSPLKSRIFFRVYLQLLKLHLPLRRSYFLLICFLFC